MMEKANPEIMAHVMILPKRSIMTYNLKRLVKCKTKTKVVVTYKVHMALQK